ALALCGASSGLIRHLFIDFVVILRTLFAPDSPLGVLDFANTRTIGVLMDHPEAAYWDGVLTDAAGTAIGRARIALLVALAQWPSWAGFATPDPEPEPAHPDDLDDYVAGM